MSSILNRSYPFITSVQGFRDNLSSLYKNNTLDNVSYHLYELL